MSILERQGASGLSSRRRDELARPGAALIDPQTLMRLVAKNAKRGAQFTPQGLLKYPLTAARPDEVLLEIHEVLEKLAPAPVNA